MQTRFWDRSAAALSVALLAGLAAFSYYLAELSDRFERPAIDPRVAHEPDYFVEGFAVTRMNARGDPVFRLSAERLVHFPDDDSSEMVNPRLVSLDPARPLVTLSAQRGRTDTGAEATHLYDDVRLVRAGVRGEPPLQVDTEYVLLLTRENIARSDREVRITRGASSLTGVGMEFDNAARVLTVQSRVRGVWTTPEQR
ncbi:MAG TPA: LPS export ABC transporter periplasmic protein LptC [Quisquiliibacterium sp.]|nr:LPS export ABC transporter periplasmic protein LptC [Quisquiliibacterium sp.]HPA88566.1 LPS export ABC transporter periplasmic protein LptC [Quisquiliibacterium sp.]HQD81579.1 LPS export ABC transporter periplasmic protein LptC [Quisquiliibacterium sp.]HQN10856.1 LPS export ABC transporter periplasmic protein LptC [Quisquiliibacterium sp.]HQP65209.1 LPS export ABC transporter periplasmic protein LptC [Quisquiliibacterium sp.]